MYSMPPLLRVQVHSTNLLVCIYWSWPQVVLNHHLLQPPPLPQVRPPFFLRPPFLLLWPSPPFLLRPPFPKAANRTLGQLLVVSLEELSSSGLSLALLSCRLASPDHPNQLPHTVLFLWWNLRMEEISNSAMPATHGIWQASTLL